MTEMVDKDVLETDVLCALCVYMPKAMSSFDF